MVIRRHWQNYNIFQLLPNMGEHRWFVHIQTKRLTLDWIPLLPDNLICWKVTITKTTVVRDTDIAASLKMVKNFQCLTILSTDRSVLRTLKYDFVCKQCKFIIVTRLLGAHNQSFDIGSLITSYQSNKKIASSCATA
jgi:hypothetical protein